MTNTDDDKLTSQFSDRSSYFESDDKIRELFGCFHETWRDLPKTVPTVSLG